MIDLENLNPMPEEPKPQETSAADMPEEPATPVEETLPADLPTSEAEPAPAEPTETPTETPAEPTETPKTLYRWSYADEAAHSAKGRGKGVVVYAAIMTGIFLLSFGLLLGVLLLDDATTGAPGLLRPGTGITETVSDEEAIVAVEQAKHSVVVIEARTSNGTSTGTGIIMTADGYIATNHHVIENATRIKVSFYDGRVMEATVVGSSAL